jgi:hypothetical protein
MLPVHEIDILLWIVTDALALAATGRLADGYRVLAAGRYRAQETASEGVEWGEELLDRWQLACENYCCRFGVPLE